MKTIWITILLGCATAEASLIHLYEFQNTLADSLGGPSLASLGGTVSAGQYTFSAGQGLNLSNALTGGQTSSYTITINFVFQEVAAWRKILDFKNLASESGLYVFNTVLAFYPFTNSTNSVFAPGTLAKVALTRDNATNLVTGYVNGVQQFQLSDVGALAVFNSANNIVNLFKDDNLSGGREASAGSVREIRFYDVALTAPQVAAVAAIPEPSSLTLFSLGALLLLRARRCGIWCQRHMVPGHMVPGAYDARAYDARGHMRHMMPGFVWGPKLANWRKSHHRKRGHPIG